MGGSAGRIATGVFTGGLSEVFGAATKSGGNKAVTAGQANRISPEEQALLTLMMGMYENPKATPSYIVDQYLTAMGKAESFYKTFPVYAEKKLAEANASYAQELSGIQATPGTGITFDGKPVTTVFPLKTMATQAGLATDKYTGAHDTITDTLAAKTAAQEALSKIASDRYAATITPIQSLWNSMYQGRFGGSVGVTAYEPSWAEKFLSAAASAAGSVGKAGV